MCCCCIPPCDLRLGQAGSIDDKGFAVRVWTAFIAAIGLLSLVLAGGVWLVSWLA